MVETKKGRVTDKNIAILKRIYPEFRANNMYVLAVDTGNLELGKVSRTPLNKRIDVDHSDTNSMYTVREQEEKTPVTNRPKLVETP